MLTLLYFWGRIFLFQPPTAFLFYLEVLCCYYNNVTVVLLGNSDAADTDAQQQQHNNSDWVDLFFGNVECGVASSGVQCPCVGIVW